MELPPPRYEAVHRFIEDLAGGVLHPKQVDSLAHAVTGAMHADAANINAIGRAAARARQVSTKHSIKQVDRLLANSKVDALKVMQHVVPILVAEQSTIAVAVEWTEFESDGHSTATVSMVTQDGPAMPLMWITMAGKKSKRRGQYEDRLRRLLRLSVPEHVHVEVLGDGDPLGPKDRRFGLPLQDTMLSAPGRRDRMLLILALGRMFTVLVRPAGNGLDSNGLLRAHAETRGRTHSILREGRDWLASVARAASGDVRRTFSRLWCELRASNRMHASN
jgi:hypothetical protein